MTLLRCQAKPSARAKRRNARNNKVFLSQFLSFHMLGPSKEGFRSVLRLPFHFGFVALRCDFFNSFSLPPRSDKHTLFPKGLNRENMLKKQKMTWVTPRCSQIRTKSHGLQVFIPVDVILGSPKSEKRKIPIVSSSKVGSKADGLRHNFRAGRSGAEQLTSIPHIWFFLTYFSCVIFARFGTWVFRSPSSARVWDKRLPNFCSIIID